MTVPPTNINPAGKLMAHQLAMPKLPVPTLKETLDKYLTTVRPLLTDAEFAQTQAAVQDFARPNGLGAKLQQRLEQRAASTNTSWLYSWWNDVAYMAYRDPVVIYVSYFFQFYDADRKSLQPQTKRAAELVSGIMAFREKVVSQELTPEMARNEPLCSIQYNYMFNSCRIPVKPADMPATYDPKTNNHVLVLRKNQFFTFDAIHPHSGKPLSTAEIQAQLDRIMALAGENKGLPLGALTTDNRDTWTDVRAKLLALHPGNEQVLDKIQSSVFALCLDDSSPVTREEVGRALWHGDGRNRWFDKSLQFVVFENGKAGFNGEHSMMDATPTGRLCEWVLDSLAKGKVDHGSPHVSIESLPEPEQLRLVVDGEIAGAVRDAEAKFDKLAAQHDFQVLAYDGYGKGLIKTFGVSPDAYVQLALQLAYYKMYGECRATYESAQTRKFAYGRTETGRSVSMESVAFVKAMADPNVPHAERVAKAKAAIAYHGKYMKDASEGRGVDRHLLGLRMLLQPGEDKPKIFTDAAYAKSCHWNLSTSQLTSEYFDGYGWGEVVPDGYGLAYMIKEKSIHVNIVSQHLGNLRFRHYLTEALQDMRVAFESVVAAQGVAGKSKL
ncbi:acyltransferase ChoActase/COT/CPT [Catenaria anguillulae PL171]|uniref:Carnitine O-acetyltransferase, mitochondrial n=1 Tax=Catenaria anguillulae PL171 TaxID=765915 RepID=A0A1Y2HWW1_9FUNG|nr:acyltransferase ChoActase/COT/CPT [Catenaria anguillulae PL171]